MPLGYSPIATVGIGAAGSSSFLPSASASFSVTGVQATSALGTVTPSGKARVTLDSAALSMLSEIGLIELVSGNAGLTLVGVQAFGRVGSPATITTNANIAVFVTGLEASGLVGDANATVLITNVTTSLSGVQGTGAVGAVTVPGVVSSFPVLVTGVQATGVVGDLPSATQTSSVVVSLPAMSMPNPTISVGTGTGVGAQVMSFGTDLLNMQPSQWTRIEPV